MGRAKIEAFLMHLAVERHVATSTQHQALSALLFLYKAVLHQEVESVDAVRARKPKRLPTVLTKTDALRVLNAMGGVLQLMAKLLYGSGVGYACLLPGGLIPTVVVVLWLVISLWPEPKIALAWDVARETLLEPFDPARCVHLERVQRCIYQGDITLSIRLPGGRTLMEKRHSYGWMWKGTDQCPLRSILCVMM